MCPSVTRITPNVVDAFSCNSWEDKFHILEIFPSGKKQLIRFSYDLYLRALGCRLNCKYSRRYTPRIFVFTWFNIDQLSGGSGTFSLGGQRGHGFGLWSINRNNYRFPTTNHTMQVFGSDA